LASTRIAGGLLFRAFRPQHAKALIKSRLGFDRLNQRWDLLRKKPAMLRRFIIDIRLDLIPTLSNYGLDSHRWRFLVDPEEPFQAVY
jgi:hypothetical protein